MKSEKYQTIETNVSTISMSLNQNDEKQEDQQQMRQRFYKLLKKQKITKQQYYEMCQIAIKFQYFKQKQKIIRQRIKFTCPKIFYQKYQKFLPDRQLQAITQTFCSLFQAQDDIDNILQQQQYKQLEEFFFQKKIQSPKYQSNFSLKFQQIKQQQKLGKICMKKVSQVQSHIYIERFRSQIPYKKGNILCKRIQLNSIINKKNYEETPLQKVSKLQKINVMNNLFLLNK